MKQITKMAHLEDYGIIPLTGESDAHMYRILCDITARGKRVIERALGVEIRPADAWNTGRTSDPHIGSFLLPQELTAPLAVFALLGDTNITEVWLLREGGVMGFGVEDVEAKEEYKKLLEGKLQKIFYSRPSDRNVHQMTGRLT